MAHVCTRRLMIGDIDSAGIAFTGRLITIAMEILEEGMLQVGIDFSAMIRAGNFGMPTVHLDADFSAPLRHGDTIRGELICERLGDTSNTMRIDIIHVEKSVVAARIRLVAACVDLKAMTSTAMPADIRSKLQRLSSDAPRS